jgi:hypothetical protein
MTGFVLLSRDLLENDLWRMNSDLVRLFIYLLLKANFSDTSYTYRATSATVTVSKGEFLRSFRGMADDCAYVGNNKMVKWSTSQVARMIAVLEEDGRIEILSQTRLGTHCRLTNFKHWQSFSAYSKKGLGTHKEPSKHKKKQNTSKKETDALWQIWLEEFSRTPPHPRLTEKRRSVLNHLLLEQLSSNGSDPLVLFRKVLKAVKGSSFHMKTRSYQLPESLFRDENRREQWCHRALAKAKGDPSTPTVSRDWSVEQ